MSDSPSSEPEPIESPVSLVSDTIGERLQAVRKKNGLSQRELARRAEITNSTLSMIEQSKVSPSIASLEKILRALPMTLQEFFSDSLELSPPVFRASDFVKVIKDGTTNEIMPLLEAKRDGVYLARQTYKAGARISSEWMLRKGFMGGIVVSGSLRLVLDGITYNLTPGEGFHFSLHRSHAFVNQTKDDCVVICVSFSERRGG